MLDFREHMDAIRAGVVTKVPLTLSLQSNLSFYFNFFPFYPLNMKIGRIM